MGFNVTIYKKCDDDTKTITHPLYKVIARLKRTKKYKMVKVLGPYSNNQYSFVFTSQKDIMCKWINTNRTNICNVEEI